MGRVNKIRFFDTPKSNRQTSSVLSFLFPFVISVHLSQFFQQVGKISFRSENSFFFQVCFVRKIKDNRTRPAFKRYFIMGSAFAVGI